MSSLFPQSVSQFERKIDDRLVNAKTKEEYTKIFCENIDNAIKDSDMKLAIEKIEQQIKDNSKNYHAIAEKADILISNNADPKLIYQCVYDIFQIEFNQETEKIVYNILLKISKMPNFEKYAATQIDKYVHSYPDSVDVMILPFAPDAIIYDYLTLPNVAVIC